MISKTRFLLGFVILIRHTCDRDRAAGKTIAGLADALDTLGFVPS
jgi:hypothetical protein